MSAQKRREVAERAATLVVRRPANGEHTYGSHCSHAARPVGRMHSAQTMRVLSWPQTAPRHFDHQEVGCHRGAPFQMRATPIRPSGTGSHPCSPNGIGELYGSKPRFGPSGT